MSDQFVLVVECAKGQMFRLVSHSADLVRLEMSAAPPRLSLT